MLSIIKKLDHKIFFPYLEDAIAEKYFVLKDTAKYTYDERFFSKTSDVLKEYLKKCSANWLLEEFYFHYTEKCTIEPSAGWAITEDNKVIPQSVWNYYIHRVNKPYFLKYKLFPKKKIHLKSAISLQYAWMNYWHFHNDILGQLLIADKAGVPKDTPIVVPAGLRDQKYFQQIVSLSETLKNRNWVFQEKNTLIQCDELHLFNSFYDHRKNFDGVLDYIKFDENLKKEEIRNDRIFIGRNKHRGRNIINMEEVSKILKNHSVEVIDPDKLTLAEQINVFQNAGYIIGIHGAGFTNIVYRRNNPLKLLEIFPQDYLNPSFPWLCQQYNFDYYGVVGSALDGGKKSNGNGNFTIDIEEFENRVKDMFR